MAAAMSVSDFLSQGFPVPRPPQLNAPPVGLNKLPLAQMPTHMTSCTIRELLASIETAERTAATCEQNRHKQDSLGISSTSCAWRDCGIVASLLESAMEASDSRPETPHWGAKDLEGESPSTAEYVEVASDGTAFDTSDEWSFDDSPQLDCLESMTPVENEKVSSFAWQPSSTEAKESCYKGGDESTKASLLSQEMATQFKEQCGLASSGGVKKYGVIARAVQKIAAARLGVGAHAESHPLVRCSNTSVLSLGDSSGHVAKHKTMKACFDDPSVPIVKDYFWKVQSSRTESVSDCRDPSVLGGTEHHARDEVQVLSANQLYKSDDFSSAVADRLHSVLHRLDDVAQSWALNLPPTNYRKEDHDDVVGNDLKKASCPSSPYSEHANRCLCSDKRGDPSKLQCRSGHSLLEASKDNHWMCDVCDKMFMRGMQTTRHRCAWCDYDVCNACSSQGPPVTQLSSDTLAQMSPRTLNNEIAMPLMGCVDDLGKAYAWLDEANSRYFRSGGTYLPEALYNQACCLCLGAESLLRCSSKAISGLPPFVPEPQEALVETRLDLALEKIKMAVAAGTRNKEKSNNTTCLTQQKANNMSLINRSVTVKSIT